MSDRPTPETDAELNIYLRHGEAHQVSVPWIEFARKLERERGGKTSEKKVLSLLTEVILLVEKKDFDLKEILKQLRKISEIEKALNEDPFSI